MRGRIPGFPLGRQAFDSRSMPTRRARRTKERAPQAPPGPSLQGEGGEALQTGVGAGVGFHLKMIILKIFLEE